MKKKAKLCFLCEYYPPESLGGAEIAIFSLINSIKEEFEVHVLTPNYQSEQNILENQNGVFVHKFKSIRYKLRKKTKTSGKNNKTYKKDKALFYLKLSFYQRFSSRELAKEFDNLNKSEKFDAVFANNIESTLALPNIKSKIKRFGYFRDIALLCPSYKTCNKDYCKNCSVNNLKKCLNEKNSLKAFLIKKLIIDYRLKQIKKIERFIAINDYLKKILAEHYSHKNIYVLADPVDERIISRESKKSARKYLNIPLNKKILLFVGSFSYIKGFHLLNEIIPKIKKDTSLIAIGDGPLREDADKKLVLLNGLSRDMMAKYYRAADVLISLPTVNYGCGMVQVEAQANKLPVVITGIGGIEEEIIDGKTGLIGMSPNEILNLSYKVIEDKSLNERITNGAKKIVRKHRISKISKEFVEVIKHENIAC